MDDGSAPREGLRAGRFIIPESELVESFSTPGGPGGQHANRNATAVELRFSIADSAVFTPEIRERLVGRLGDTLTINASESRSQFRNRAIARQRLADTISEALRPSTPRRPTRPSRGAVRRRLEQKGRRSEVKNLRRRPHTED